MGILDKLFNRDTDEEPLMGIIEDPKSLSSLPFEDEIAEVRISTAKGCVIRIDKSKEIKAEHWDGLSDEARKALSAQGFYREGDNAKNRYLEVEL
jgi:hypothetical protein